ncbi:uncharacterized protein LOC129287248 isoform X2 [Prosopis cineraria]|uniref:uncharacterized protein LOC129287013 isoform X2 n=1 Tax=Prosopis cineraria TaxID=364024 RepID=UPI00240FE093|nr:uncharacterized protein LOC129287013 isoform X2 [Prosopis cineraria]XP_054779415.1 uncharacterized protein LOC129287248 isoform X2 [Prosopis cineraria]
MGADVQRVTSASVESTASLCPRLDRAFSSLLAPTIPIPMPTLTTCNADALSSSISDSVGQFTLYGLLKGNKPGFQRTPFMLLWLIDSRNACNTDAIKDGVFGAMMKVSLVNDGPVTMQLDSQSPD